MEVLIVPYLLLGYWAAGRVWFANKVVIGSASTIFIYRLVMGLLMGWALIPIAIIRALIGK